MQILRTRQTKTSNIFRNLLLFFLFFGFSFSNPGKTNINPNPDKEKFLEMLKIGDMSFLENKEDFLCLTSIIENEKNVIIRKKSLEDFNNTVIYILTSLTYEKFLNNRENFPKKEINRLLNIIFKKISEISKYKNNEFFEKTILNLTGIYSIIENNDLILRNFDKKIFPIINKITFKKNKKNKILMKYIIKFIDLTRNKNLYYNLAKNKKLKKFFINIINEYISLEIDIERYMDNYSILIDNFLNYYKLANIDNDKTLKNVYFEIIDCFLENYIKILKDRNIKNICIINMQCFHYRLFQNQYYLENVTSLKKITKFLGKMANFRLKISNSRAYICKFTIYFYTNYIATISEENQKKFNKIIKIFEENMSKYIELINEFIKKPEYSFYNQTNYFKTIIILNNINMNYENDKFINNSKLVEKINKTLINYIEKIVISEYNKIYSLVNLFKNDLLKSFYVKDHLLLKKYDFKKMYRVIVREALINFYETSEDKKLPENISSELEYKKKFLKWVFLFEIIDMGDEEISNLVFRFLKNYSNKFSISVNKVKDFEFYIFLNCSISNLVKKLDMNENTKNIYLKKINKFSFGKEIDEFIEKHKIKKNLKIEEIFIIKYINAIIDSKNKILEDLEILLNEEDFYSIMINFIDNLKKLDKFYDTETNNNSEFRKTYHIFKNNIFYHKIVENSSEHNSNNIPIFYWGKTKRRKKIFEYFEKIFIFNSDSENELES